MRLLLRFQRFAWDIGGVLLLAFTLMTLLALVNLTDGRMLQGWAEFLRHGLGIGSFCVPVVTGISAIYCIRQGVSRQISRNPVLTSPHKIQWGRILALEIGAFALLAFLAIMGGHSVVRAEAGLDGGLVGWGLAEILGLVITSSWLLAILLSVICVTCAMVGLGIVRPLIDIMREELIRSRAGGGESLEMQPWVSPGQTERYANQPQVTLKTETGQRKIPRLPPEFRKKFKIQLKEEQGSNPLVRDERLPSLDLLSVEQSIKPDERNINLTAGMIEKSLAEFGIPAKVVGFRVGPTVTQFAVEPGFVDKRELASQIRNGEETVRQKVRVSQISALSRDLALALSAERLRIEAPVPGRPYIGIEVPNQRSMVVRLRPILESEAFYKFGSPLTIALGRDVSGQAVVADLARMPHLLIAGTTGSGKSVCIEALTACLVMNNTPEDMRLVMIDPKMVELVRFNGLPHLYGKVETDLERILGVLRWTTVEMDRRYKLLEASHSRNIDTYNRKIHKRKGAGGTPLPRIVVMIDELADLMMSSPDQTEHTLVRLAQMARATGIHLVVATQRPSTDIVTGLIKANFPARLAFATASSIDSRVILDMGGAEALLGRGDMLFLPPETGNPIRAQGVMITDQEIERIITFWQQVHPQEKAEPAPWEQSLSKEAYLAEMDDLIEKAISIVRTERRAGASMLQRRLRIGFPRAARLIDELAEMGVIVPGPSGRDWEVVPEAEVNEQ